MFVCLGNICRSPVARAVFEKQVNERGLAEHFVIDSCGTGGWHVGEGAHAISRATAKKYGVSLDSHRAKQISDSDFHVYDLFVVMDQSNYADLVDMGASRFSKVVHLREYDPQQQKDLNVPDPFFGTGDGFPIVHEMIDRCCEKLLDELEKDLNQNS